MYQDSDKELADPDVIARPRRGSKVPHCWADFNFTVQAIASQLDARIPLWPHRVRDRLKSAWPDDDRFQGRPGKVVTPTLDDLVVRGLAVEQVIEGRRAFLLSPGTPPCPLPATLEVVELDSPEEKDEIVAKNGMHPHPCLEVCPETMNDVHLETVNAETDSTTVAIDTVEGLSEPVRVRLLAGAGVAFSRTEVGTTLELDNVVIDFGPNVQVVVVVD